MFVKNDKHSQKSLFYAYNVASKKVEKFLENSWSKNFYKYIFSQIDESKFSVLYSEKGSRPNIPVNILVSLEIIKYQFNYSDEELISEYYTDLKIMDALGMSELAEQELSIRTLYNFRKRLVNYEKATGKSLIKEEFKNLTGRISKVFNIKLTKQRVDTTYIESNIKQLTRLELISKVIEKFLKELDEEKVEELSEELKKLKKEGNSKINERVKPDETEEELNKYLRYLKELYERYSKDEEISKRESFKNLERVIEEQTKLKESGELKLKEKEEISSGSMQNPSDPEATYVENRGKKHKGYKVMVSESCSEDNALQLLTSVELESNNVGDDKLLIKELNEEGSHLKEAKDLLADSGFLTEESKRKAEEESVNLHITGIKGRKPKEGKIELSKFKIEGTKLKSCPNGKEPISQKYKKRRKKIISRFKKSDCENCPLRESCISKEGKQFYSVYIDLKSYQISKRREKLESEEYRKFLRKRSGVEGTIMQLIYKMGHRSRLRGKIKIRNSMIYRAISINLIRITKYLIKLKKEIKRGIVKEEEKCYVT